MFQRKLCFHAGGSLLDKPNHHWALKPQH